MIVEGSATGRLPADQRLGHGPRHLLKGLPSDHSLGIVIVNYNGGDDLRCCIDTLRLQLGEGDKIIVIDNASTDGSATFVEGLDDQIRVVSRPNDGFGGGANAGAAVAQTEFLLFANPDTEFSEGAVDSLRRSLVASGGIVGPVLIEGVQAKVCFGATLDVFGSPGSIAEATTPPLYVPGCALGISSTLFERLGGFDARYFLFMEDVELCWRAWIVGAEVSVDKDARCMHRGGGSIPGGYAETRGWSTSVQRIALRERNALATYLTCLPVGLILPGLLLATARMVTLGTAFTLLGRPKAAREILKGLAWSYREMPRSLRRRRSLETSRHARWRPLRHLGRRCFYMGVVRSVGLPRIERGKPV